MDIQLIQLALIFFIIAAFYSSAGFGGGSSYLAVLALFALPFTQLRMIALICNMTVVSGSVYLMWREGHLLLKRILPLIVLSVPLSFIGGRFRIEERFFFILLGFTLCIAALTMIFFRPIADQEKVNKLSKYSNGIIGGGIGFLSGLVGIGGGIFLSPILHLTNWAKVKTIAATTALFILVNSLSGLIGQISVHGFDLPIHYLLVLIIAVILGGQIGVRTTINHLSPQMIKKMTAVLILIVSFRLLNKYLFCFF